MKNFLCTILLFVFTINLFSQTECNCKMALANVIAKIESEYPGFEEKTKDTLLYNNLKTQLFAEAIQKDDSQCLDVLKKYTTFFKDRHIWILRNEQEIPANPETINKPKELEINIAEFKKGIKNSKHKLEGIWKDETYTVGVSKTGEAQYTGVSTPPTPY